MITRFWVVGGEYTDTQFSALAGSTPIVEGPFQSEEEATQVWRHLSSQSSSLAHTRFSIMSERMRLAS